MASRDSLEVTVCLALGIGGLGEYKREDVALKFDRPQQFRVSVGAIQIQVVIVLWIVKDTWDEEGLAPREVLLYAFDDDGHFEDLLSIWSLLRRHLKQCLYQHSHVHGIMTGNRWILSLEHALEQTIHVIGLKGRLQMAHLVSYAA